MASASALAPGSCPVWIAALPLFHDELKLNCEENKLFSPHVAFGHGVHHSQSKLTWNIHWSVSKVKALSLNTHTRKKKVNENPLIHVKFGSKTEDIMNPEKMLKILSMNLEEVVIKKTR